MSYSPFWTKSKGDSPLLSVLGYNLSGKVAVRYIAVIPTLLAPKTPAPFILAWKPINLLSLFREQDFPPKSLMKDYNFEIMLS